MTEIVLVITGISAFLAIIVVISDRFFNNYGECRININEDKELLVQGGQSLLSSLSDNKIFIPSACGGRATCGLCKVQIREGGGFILPTEEPFLTSSEKAMNIRLSCQVKVKNDMEIIIPEEFFNIREYITTLQRITDMTYDIKEFRLKLDESGDINFKAGQYVQVRTKPYGKIKETVSRAYSIASIPSEKGIIDLIVRKVPGGICTTYMHDFLSVSDSIAITGPYGDFYIRENASQYIFLAGGSGLAPIKSMILDLLLKKSEKEMHFFFGAVSKKDLFYYDYFREIENKHKNFHYYPSLSSPQPHDDWDGETGLVTEVLLKHIKTFDSSHAYLCGSPGMIDACINVLTEIGFTEDHIFYDKF